MQSDGTRHASAVHADVARWRLRSRTSLATEGLLRVTALEVLRFCRLLLLIYIIRPVSFVLGISAVTPDHSHQPLHLSCQNRHGAVEYCRSLR